MPIEIIMASKIPHVVMAGVDNLIVYGYLMVGTVMQSDICHARGSHGVPFILRIAAATFLTRPARVGSAAARASGIPRLAASSIAAK